MGRICIENVLTNSERSLTQNTHFHFVLKWKELRCTIHLKWFYGNSITETRPAFGRWVSFSTWWSTVATLSGSWLMTRKPWASPTTSASVTTVSIWWISCCRPAPRNVFCWGTFTLIRGWMDHRRNNNISSWFRSCSVVAWNVISSRCDSRDISVILSLLLLHDF